VTQKLFWTTHPHPPTSHPLRNQNNNVYFDSAFPEANGILYLLYHDPSLRSCPAIGAPQADIFHHYKQAILRATALDRATRHEERRAKREKRLISPENIEELTERYLRRMPYKSTARRYHSFIIYFSNLQRLGWAEFSGVEEPSAFQAHYPSGQPRRYYRLNSAGIAASDTAWANPFSALYGGS
jgi:hypothetical protein